MPQTRNIIGYLLIEACFVRVAHAAATKPVQITKMFCVSKDGGSWTAQKFKPLINPRAKTTFAEMSFAETRLLEFKVERFSEHAGVTFDYKFDEKGRLNSLIGTVEVTDSWVGRTNLTPEADGTVSPSHFEFYKGNLEITRPEDAGDYVHLLDAPPVYRTADAVPCAAMTN